MAISADPATVTTTDTEAPVLEVRDLSASFFTRRGEVRAVREVSFSLRQGETLALVGESGSGKTATAMSILRMLPNTGRIMGGEIIFQGEDLLGRSQRKMAHIRGRHIGLIPQDPAASLNPLMTVGQHLTELLGVHLGMRGRPARERAIELLTLVGIPEPGRRFDAYPYQLSGGMRQRVMIALAIACHPAVLIADEPTTALDSTVQAQILELIATLSREMRTATILITHNLGIVAGVCDRVAVMYAGRIAEVSPRDPLFAEPRHPYTLGLLRCVPRVDKITARVFQSIPGQPPDLIGSPSGCAFAPRCAYAGDRCVDETPQMTPTVGDHRAACWHQDRIEGAALVSPPVAVATGGPSQSGDSDPSPGADRVPVVEVRDLKMHFPIGHSALFGNRHEVVRAVDGVSLSIRKGETLGLVGESGCGKSTLGRVVAGLYRPTSGKVLFDGVDIGQLSGQELRSLRRRFQIVFQDPFMSLNPRMTVGGLIGEGLAIHRIGKPHERPARVAELMDLVGLRREHVSRYPHEFSGGQRQRIAIARALAPDPELIVLDEPVSALDVSIQSQILRLLVDLQQRLGLTYLLIGHDLAVIGNMCQRVTVMYLGRVVETAERGSLYRMPLHPYTRALFSAAPVPDPTVERTRRRIVLAGEVPSPVHPPAGCRFHTRCPVAVERCRTDEPALREISLDGRSPADQVACHLAETVAAGSLPVLEGTWTHAG